MFIDIFIEIGIYNYMWCLYTSEASAEREGLREAEGLFKGAEETLGGFPIGAFVKITVSGVSKQWLEGIEPARPIILGGLNAGELQCTFMQVYI